MKNALPLILVAFLLWFGITQRDAVPPGPTPDDDVPVVVEDKGIIDADGFYVLIVEEKDDRRNLPAKQASILIPSSQLTGWFFDHQVQWRIFDTNDQDTSSDDPHWQKALSDLKRDSLPWLYVQISGKQKFSGPLPGTVADTIALLQQQTTRGSQQ